MAEQLTQQLRAEINTLRAQNHSLAAFRHLIVGAGMLLDFAAVLPELARRIHEVLGWSRTIILVPDEEGLVLRLGASSDAPESTEGLAQLRFRLLDYDPGLRGWVNGERIWLRVDHPSREAQHLLADLNQPQMLSIPLLFNEQLCGVVLAQPDADDAEPNSELLDHVSLSAAITLNNARVYTRTIERSADSINELSIFRRIDHDLNDTIDAYHVLQMTMDWALRFTNAQAASIALYDQETDELRVHITYGYDIPDEQIDLLRQAHNGGIAHRVARSGYADIIPDVNMDKDFVRACSIIQSQMSVPVLREDRVIAVITVESRKLNGFTDAHLDFVEKLAARAGVAIDNARLFAQTMREHEKLAQILNNTADVIIVCNHDERLMLINPSGISALQLDPQIDQAGRSFEIVFADTALLPVYRRARLRGESMVEEITLPDGRIFYANLVFHDQIGWVIVMHDITPFKEMDRLKSELISTVSHDLKQPLSVITGYIELLLMHKRLDETGLSFIEMVRKSVNNMRQLIDDLLDLAKIEAGIQIEQHPIHIKSVLMDCLDLLEPIIQSKNLIMTVEVPDQIPLVLGDYHRLQQVFHNLIGNAVKYTPPNGWVRVMAETRGSDLRVLIQDSGIGISPEDQVHIFDRFYRVRRPETDAIEGTGLGLAIVKTLIEAHHGSINLDSRLNEGTTFYINLPGEQRG